MVDLVDVDGAGVEGVLAADGFAVAAEEDGDVAMGDADDDGVEVLVVGAGVGVEDVDGEGGTEVERVSVVEGAAA